MAQEVKKVEGYQLGNNSWQILEEPDALFRVKREKVLLKYLSRPHDYSGSGPYWFDSERKPSWKFWKSSGDKYLEMRNKAYTRGNNQGREYAYDHLISEFARFYSDIKRELDAIDANEAALKAAA